MKQHEEKFLKEMMRVTVLRDERVNALLKGYTKTSCHEFALTEITIALNSYRCSVMAIEQEYLRACIENLVESIK